MLFHMQLAILTCSDQLDAGFRRWNSGNPFLHHPVSLVNPIVGEGV
jgi:hypothetical protein